METSYCLDKSTVKGRWVKIVGMVVLYARPFCTDEHSDPVRHAIR